MDCCTTGGGDEDDDDDERCSVTFYPYISSNLTDTYLTKRSFLYRMSARSCLRYASMSRTRS